MRPGSVEVATGCTMFKETQDFPGGMLAKQTRCTSFFCEKHSVFSTIEPLNRNPFVNLHYSCIIGKGMPGSLSATETEQSNSKILALAVTVCVGLG